MEQFENVVEPKQLQEEYMWATDTFPALHKYKTEHSTENLQKLCVEISQFCNAVYASTQNDTERAIYNNMVKKLNK